ncbi:MAG: hypothetical protein HY259_06620 [Chloroflexi bacterium]|nr:hypothetical protein [Chloroflexota bacterium]
MATRALTKQDLWDSVIGGTVLGTGGGGIAASRGLFDLEKPNWVRILDSVWRQVYYFAQPLYLFKD